MVLNKNFEIIDNPNDYIDEMDRLVVPYNHQKRITDNFYKIISFKGIKFCLTNILGNALMGESNLSPYESFEKVVEFRTTTESALMTLPCTNAVDARSVESFCIPKGQSLLVDSVIENPKGEKWLCLNWEGARCYLTSSCAARTTEVNKLLDILF